jgi:hypothetical protein
VGNLASSSSSSWSYVVANKKKNVNAKNPTSLSSSLRSYVVAKKTKERMRTQEISHCCPFHRTVVLRQKIEKIMMTWEIPHCHPPHHKAMLQQKKNDNVKNLVSLSSLSQSCC